MKPGKGYYYYAEKEGLLFVRPTTWINESGIAVSELILHFSLSFENILIILDDMDLPFGKLRMRNNGSAGGNKGLASVIYHLDSEDIPRLRIGIGKPEKGDAIDWVLSPFTEKEEEEINEIMESAKKAIFLWADENIEAAMSTIN